MLKFSYNTFIVYKINSKKSIKNLPISQLFHKLLFFIFFFFIFKNFRYTCYWAHNTACFQRQKYFACFTVGNFTDNISGGSGTLTGYSDGNSKVYVDWAKPTAIGKFIINDDAKTDTLDFKNTTKAAFSKDNFSKDGYRLTIDFDKSINGVGEVVIDNWSDNSSYCAFKGTILFVDKNNKLTGESLTYNEIKSFLS